MAESDHYSRKELLAWLQASLAMIYHVTTPRRAVVLGRLVDPSTRARDTADVYLGHSLLFLGEYDALAEHANHALQRANLHPIARAEIMRVLGHSLNSQGDSKQARQLMTDALKGLDREAEPATYAGMLSAIGTTHFDEGEIDQAERCYREAFALFSAHDVTRGIGTCILNLGSCHAIRKDYETARQTFQDGLDISRSCSDRMSEMRALGYLGFICLVKREYEQAAGLLREAFDLACVLSVPRHMALSGARLALALIARSCPALSDFRAQSRTGNMAPMLDEVRDVFAKALPNAPSLEKAEQLELDVARFLYQALSGNKAEARRLAREILACYPESEWKTVLPAYIAELLPLLREFEEPDSIEPCIEWA